jgi:ribonuclease T2
MLFIRLIAMIGSRELMSMWLNSKILGRLCVLAAVVGLLYSENARAEVPLDGSFVAGANCSAFQSIKKKSNPVPLEAGHSYQIVAKNKEAASHFLIIVPGASPERRWTPVDCGSRSGGTAAGNETPANEEKASPGLRTQYVLAASWQAGFCETKPDKVECRSQTPERFDASHLSLHGLWPQPRNAAYCKVDKAAIEDDKAGRWDELPEVTLSQATSDELKTVMPGTQSHLERHEWIKHGTCYGVPMEEYFADALGVMRALNDSAVQKLFASHVGQFLSFDDIRKAFDESFGKGAGNRVRMQCARDNGRLIISELTIGLTGNITPQSSLAELMAAAAPTKSECPGGIVDAAGQQ